MENPTSEGFGPPGTAPIPVLDTHTHYFVFSSSQGLEVLRDVSVSILPDGVRSTPVVEVVANHPSRPQHRWKSQQLLLGMDRWSQTQAV